MDLFLTSFLQTRAQEWGCWIAQGFKDPPFCSPSWPHHVTGLYLNQAAPRQPGARAAAGAHLGDLAPAEVGKALERERQDVGGPVDGEALAGWNLLLASARKGTGELSAEALTGVVPMLG